MINEIDRLLRRLSAHVTPGHLGSLPQALPPHLPSEYFEILKVSNGFCLFSSAFRFFGLSSFDGIPSIMEWNRSDWINEYGHLARGLTFFAEDLFGDQYAFKSTLAGGVDLVKFWCEGGRADVLCASSLLHWLTHTVLEEKPDLFDHRLAREATLTGLRPSTREHLSFVLPLICGGAYEVSNLEVLNGSDHLSILGQISLRNLNLPDGAKIREFREATDDDDSGT
ncbi:MAG TPA: SMI1/KNR4 family protein [Planctomycetota bacterium]|jgi:hypothetical protein